MFNASADSAFVSGDSSDTFWPFRFLPALAAYGTLFLLGRFLICYVRKETKNNANFLRRHCILRLFRHFAIGRPELQVAQKTSEKATLSEREHFKGGEEGRICAAGGETNLRRRRSFVVDCVFVSVCFAGIQMTLICMGFFQERIVTRSYALKTDSKRVDFFRDTQFLVFANRIVALALSGAYLFVTWKGQPPHVAPLYLHSYASLSNVISSWCQYEALKYVSFPTQTVCKASKIVPTMLMGKFLRGLRYSVRQYLFALTLVFGTSLFFLATASTDSPHFQAVSSTRSDNLTAFLGGVSGFVLMLGYLLFDAFTPNWQKKLLEQTPRISCSQMMFGVNAFSVLICLVPLLQQRTLLSSVHFLLAYDSVLFDCLFLSFGSALGQVFIYMTIQHFGPIVLSIIMTLRQIFSIILSSVYFEHPINLQGFFGLFLVFCAIFIDIYNKYSKSRVTRGTDNGADL